VFHAGDPEAHPLQQRGAPDALALRSRDVAPSQRNLSGMPLRGMKKIKHRQGTFPGITFSDIDIPFRKN
jgi:hypothetical protein